MVTLYIFVFVACCLALFWAGSWLVDGLRVVARFLRWREFVVAFFIMAFACSLPNLFVGINSVINGIPQLSFGDIVGGNVINLTLVVGLAVLVSRSGLPAESRMVQNSAFFSTLTAVLPLLLIADGTLGRMDGVFLIATFLFYVFWLFSKEERFKKVYDEDLAPISGYSGFLGFSKNLLKIILSLAVFLVASYFMVKSAMVFSSALNVSLVLIGILVVGFGNTLPELYFSVISARKSENWMILGDLIGSVIYTSTFVLGIVALLCPIKIFDFSPFFIARIFLVISAILFLLVVRTGQKITKKEGLFLLILYVIFLIFEIIYR